MEARYHSFDEKVYAARYSVTLDPPFLDKKMALLEEYDKRKAVENALRAKAINIEALEIQGKRTIDLTVFSELGSPRASLSKETLLSTLGQMLDIVHYRIKRSRLLVLQVEETIEIINDKLDKEEAKILYREIVEIFLNKGILSDLAIDEILKSSFWKKEFKDFLNKIKKQKLKHEMKFSFIKAWIESEKETLILSMKDASIGLDEDFLIQFASRLALKLFLFRKSDEKSYKLSKDFVDLKFRKEEVEEFYFDEMIQSLLKLVPSLKDNSLFRCFFSQVIFSESSTFDPSYIVMDFVKETYFSDEEYHLLIKTIQDLSLDYKKEIPDLKKDFINLYIKNMKKYTEWKSKTWVPIFEDLKLNLQKIDFKFLRRKEFIDGYFEVMNIVKWVDDTFFKSLLIASAPHILDENEALVHPKKWTTIKDCILFQYQKLEHDTRLLNVFSIEKAPKVKIGSKKTKKTYKTSKKEEIPRSSTEETTEEESKLDIELKYNLDQKSILAFSSVDSSSELSDLAKDSASLESGFVSEVDSQSEPLASRPISSTDLNAAYSDLLKSFPNMKWIISYLDIKKGMPLLNEARLSLIEDLLNKARVDWSELLTLVDYLGGEVQHKSGSERKLCFPKKALQKHDDFVTNPLLDWSPAYLSIHEKHGKDKKILDQGRLGSLRTFFEDIGFTKENLKKIRHYHAILEKVKRKEKKTFK